MADLGLENGFDAARRISDYPSLHAARIPDHVALIEGDGAERTNLTYAELAGRVETFAAALLASGVRPGQRVAFMGAPSIDFVVSFLGTAAVGAVWQGLNPRYSTRELAYVLGDARPVVVLQSLPREGVEADASARALSDAVTQALPGEQVIDLVRDGGQIAARASEVDAAVLAAAKESVRPQDAALVVYTSGSTGQPKGALIRHSGLVRLAAVESRVWGLDELVMTCNLPINHIASVGDLVCVCLVAGGTLLLRPGFDAEQMLQDVQEVGLTALFQIPTQLQRVSSLPGFADADLPSLRLVGWGGSPLPQSSITAYRKKGCGLISTYGLTEATSSVTYTDPDAPDEVLRHTVGRPDPGMRMRLLREDGTWVAEDATGEDAAGEVCINNPTTMAGYLDRPEATQAAYTPDGWLRTGDIGHLREDGNLVLVGRATEMFKSGGYNIYPREIELVLESHPAVQLVAVVPRPDPEFHEVGAAFVQPRAGACVTEEELRAHARGMLANFKVPKSFTFLPELPLLPVGKVDKTALRAAAAAAATP